LERHKYYWKKHDINERSLIHRINTNQNGEMTTHTGITSDKMEIVKSSLLIRRYGSRSCSSKSMVIGCIAVHISNTARRPCPNPIISFQELEMLCGECCDQRCFFQQTTESYSITVTNAPLMVEKLDMVRYCKGGALLPLPGSASHSNICSNCNGKKRYVTLSPCARGGEPVWLLVMC